MSLVNIDLAYLAKRRGSLTEHEKYNFYCYHFSPDIDYKFTHEGGCGFQLLVFQKVQLVDLQLAREWWVLSSLCDLC